MSFETPSFDPLATLDSVKKNSFSAENFVVPQNPDTSKNNLGSGNYRFDEMLSASGLSEPETKNFARIFAVLPVDKKAQIMEKWEAMLPRLLEATGTYAKECAEIAKNYIQAMYQKANELLLRHQENQARASAEIATLRAGTASFDQAREDKSRTSQMEKIRAMAAGAAPAGSTLGAIP